MQYIVYLHSNIHHALVDTDPIYNRHYFLLRRTTIVIYTGYYMMYDDDASSHVLKVRSLCSAPTTVTLLYAHDDSSYACVSILLLYKFIHITFNA